MTRRVGSSRASTVAHGLLDQADDPGDPLGGPLVIDLPVDDQALVGGDTPEDVEYGGHHGPVLLGPWPGPFSDGPEQRFPLTVLGIDQGRIEVRRRLPRVLGDM